MKTVTISESLYIELLEYFEDRLNAGCYDPYTTGRYTPNKEMSLYDQLDKEFKQYNRTDIPY